MVATLTQPAPPSRITARASRPGVCIYPLVVLVAVAAVALACGSRAAPGPTAERQTWDGPDARVSSVGLVIYDRREIAQKVPLPRCIAFGAEQYRFGGVLPETSGGTTPTGYLDTMYRLDRWRIYRKLGVPEPPDALYLTVRGSTGILAEYTTVPPGQACQG